MKPRILHIEDEAVFRMLCQQVMAEYQWTGAADVAEGVHALQHHCFDVVILDMRLPGTTDTHHVRAIKALCGPAALIVVSGISELRTILEAIHFGADDYIVKDGNEEFHIRLRIEIAIQRAARTH